MRLESVFAGEPDDQMNVRKPPVCCRTFSLRAEIWLRFRFRNLGKT